MNQLKPCRKDKMLPIERLTAVMNGQAVDRFPCVPFLGEPCAKLLGKSIRAYWHSADNMVDAEIAAFNRFGHDSLGVGPDAYGIAEALGAHVVFPENATPYIEKPFLTDYAMLPRLQPLNPEKDGRLPVFFQACRLLQKEAAHIVGVGSSVAGPFTIAAYLRGVDNLLRDVIHDQTNAHKLMQYVTDACKIWIDKVAPLGLSISMADPLASPSVLSPRLFQSVVLPYFKQIMCYAWKKTGSKPSLHFCGNTYKVWPYLKGLPLSSLSLDNVIDLSKAKTQLGASFCLMGNVDPVKVIAQGTPELVEQAVAECIAKAGNNPRGFVVASGCQVPLHAPLEQVDAMLAAVRKLGQPVHC